MGKGTPSRSAGGDQLPDPAAQIVEAEEDQSVSSVNKETFLSKWSIRDNTGIETHKRGSILLIRLLSIIPYHGYYYDDYP